MRTNTMATTIANTTETAITIAGGAGVYDSLTKLSITNNGVSAVTVTIRDHAGGSAVFTYTVAAGQSVGFYGVRETQQSTANAAWTAQLSAAISVTISTEWNAG